MIVDSMTHEEVYAELERDREAMTRWWNYKKERIARTAIKTTRFPLNLWIEHTSPRKVRYFFHTRIFEKRMRHFLTGIIAVRRQPDGWSAYTTWMDYQQLISPMVLIPHVFKRYAERCDIEKTGIDLVKHFFTNNSIGKDSHDQRVVARSVRYNGEEHQSSCVNEGVLLGKKHGSIFIARTFITYEMCCGRQQKEFAAMREQILTDRQLYEKARFFYNTGITF